VGTYTVVSDPDRAYAFVNEFFALLRTERMTGICQVLDGEVVAAAVYDDFNGSNLFMHGAGRPDVRWMTRAFLKELFRHPFEVIGANRITCWIEVENTRSINFVKHLGFTREAFLPFAGHAAGHVWLYRMLRNDCRYA